LSIAYPPSAYFLPVMALKMPRLITGAILWGKEKRRFIMAPLFSFFFYLQYHSASFRSFSKALRNSAITASSFASNARTISGK